MPKKEKITTCTEKELALLLTPLDEETPLTVRRVQQLEEEKIVFRVRRGEYDLHKSIRGYVGYLKLRARGKTETLANKKGIREDIKTAREMLELKKDEDVLIMKTAIKRELAGLVRSFATRLGSLESTLVTDKVEFAKIMREKMDNGGISEHDMKVLAQDGIRLKVDECRVDLAALEKWGS